MLPCLRFGWSTRLDCSIDRKSTRLNSSHTVIYTLSLHDALPISTAGRLEDKSYDFVTPLQRDVAVLALRLVDALGLQHRSEEHTSELQSHRDLHSFPTRRSSDLDCRTARRQVVRLCDAATAGCCRACASAGRRAWTAACGGRGSASSGSGGAR